MMPRHLLSSSANDPAGRSVWAYFKLGASGSSFSPGSGSAYLASFDASQDLKRTLTRLSSGVHTGNVTVFREYLRLASDLFRIRRGDNLLRVSATNPFSGKFENYFSIQTIACLCCRFIS